MFDESETGNNKSTMLLPSKVIKELLISCRKLSETQPCNLVMYQILCLLLTFPLQSNLETLLHSEKSYFFCQSSIFLCVCSSAVHVFTLGNLKNNALLSRNPMYFPTVTQGVMYYQP